MYPQAINIYLISVHANVSCTMIVGGLLDKILLILSGRSDAPLLDRLDGCYAETFSNEQGQKLDINSIPCYNNLAP
jgi:hypothetical protein